MRSFFSTDYKSLTCKPKKHRPFTSLSNVEAAVKKQELLEANMGAFFLDRIRSIAVICKHYESKCYSKMIVNAAQENRQKVMKSWTKLEVIMGTRIQQLSFIVDHDVVVRKMEFALGKYVYLTIYVETSG